MVIQQQPTMVASFDDIFKDDATAVTTEEITPQQEQVKEEEQPLVLDSPVQVQTQEEVVQKPAKTNFSTKIGTLIETGLVGNFEITVGDEKVFLSDLEINDEETYNELLSQIKEEQERTLKDKYISKDGLDETTQKLIEIKKAGGDITEVIKENVRAIDLLSSYKEILEIGEDREKEDLSISILAQELRNKGLEDEVVQVQIQAYINKGELEDRANNILNNHLSLHQQEIENKRLQEIERQNKEKEDFKTFKKTLNQKYKELGIPENTQRLLIDNATKLNEYQISNTDQLFFEARKDPEKFAKLNYFLNDPEGYEKWITGKKVTETKKTEILKSAITINTNKTKPYEKKSYGSLDDLFE
jgi:hypothetical protein